MSTVNVVRNVKVANASQRWVMNLLACGIAVAVVQIAGDIVAAVCTTGYSYVNQSVSELSAIGAPTRLFLIVVGVLYDALVVAFAAGVWKAAGRTRAMKITAALLLVFALNGLVWSFFPMQPRGSEMAVTDFAHIAGAILQVLTIVLFIAYGSGADGRWFRVFSILMIAAILIAGGAAAPLSSRISAGLPTPWFGLIERVSFYGPSLWILTLATVLLRDRQAKSSRRLASDQQAGGMSAGEEPQ